MKRLSVQEKVDRLTQLLVEAREQISDKPWDDKTYLHKRISEELGLPVSYPEFFVELD